MSIVSPDVEIFSMAIARYILYGLQGIWDVSQERLMNI